MKYYTELANTVLNELKTTTNGLTTTESKRRLADYGPNAVVVKAEPLWRKIVEPFRSVFVLVLVLAAGISLYHQAVIDAIIIIVIILISAIIYYIQEYSTEKILRSLKKKNLVETTVLRDGAQHVIDAINLVPGDIIFCEEGDKIPADARIISTRSFRVDESQLTGESLPINKTEQTISAKSEIYERTNMVYQGSFVIGGVATAVVTATGNGTEFGKLAKLSTAPRGTSPVQQKIDRLITQIIIGVSAVAVTTFGLALYRGIEFSEALRFVMALAVSAVPEGLPIAITVILALGMKRMAARRALVRTMDAIENIGTVTTIATDKTGTLTKNKLSVHKLWHLGGPTTETNRSLAHSLLPANVGKHRDPLDVAFEEHKSPKPTSAPLASYQFEHTLAMSGNLWHEGKGFALYIKGAPEKMLERCSMTENERERAFGELSKMSGSGYRVIALAHATVNSELASLETIPKSATFEFDGLVAVADILRPEAHSAIKRALQAGISVRMITGDHFETAFQIGKELGLASNRSQVFDCRYLASMSDAELEKTIDTIKVFARVIPEQKHRILTILKKHDIAAMTGDGVNDVPALTNAHVGIAMGSGAQIAKDAGDIILLDDNFRSIIHAVEEGRTIYANIKRMVSYLLATNLGEVLVSVGALLFGLPLPLSPIQLLWVNLATDTVLVIPLGLEPAEKNSMRVPPFKAAAPLLGKFAITRTLFVALTMAIVILGMYAYYYAMHDADYARTIAFAAIVVMQIASAIGYRSNTDSILKRITVKNTALIVGIAAAVGLQVLALFTPFSALLHVTSVALGDLIVTAAIAFIAPLLVIELHRLSFKHTA